MPEIRTARREEVDLLLAWAADEGWNPGLGDAEPFFMADPQGFHISLAGDQPVAALSCVRSGADFGFVGLYICRPEHRGKGYGLALWQHMLRGFTGRSLGLDGVVAQQANYAKSGFVLAHRNIRYSGRAPKAAAPRDSAVRPIERADLALVSAYDAPLYGAARDRFLASWLEGSTGRRAFMAIQKGGVAGYTVIRPCRNGFKIGPLFADTEMIAEQLFLRAAEEAAGEEIVLDLPEPNGAAERLARRFGLEPVFETARMVRGAPVDLPLQRIFGITTFELG